MNFTKKVRYGFIFALYIYRAGRATVAQAAEELKLRRPFLQQVAARLKKMDILVSVKGPGGGYSLKEDSTMLDIYLALSTYDEIVHRVAYGTQELRAVNAFLTTHKIVMHKQLNRTVKNVMQELVANEVATLQRASSSRIN